jgi:hypothetical protein
MDSNERCTFPPAATNLEIATDFPNIGLMSNTLRSIQVAEIIRCGTVRPTALPERDQSPAG